MIMSNSAEHHSIADGDLKAKYLSDCFLMHEIL
jgi:hypothetical protein